MGMSLPARIAKLPWPRTWAGWARLYCQATILFAAQGVLLLAIYSVRGFDTSPDALPLGLQLDPRHAVIHLLFGLIGAAIGFWQPEGAVPFTLFFGLFYLALAIFGTGPGRNGLTNSAEPYYKAFGHRTGKIKI